MTKMEPKLSPPRRGVYYGWIIVGVAMVSMAFWFGFRTSFAVFFATLIDHFHWSRAEAAGVQSLAMLVYMVMAPIVGTLVDRIGPRKVILPGIILTSLGLVLCTQIQTLGHFYLFFGLIAGIGIASLSLSAFTVILAHWFQRYRGRAYGLAAGGIGLGALIFVPLIQYLIYSYGWQWAFLIFGLLFILIPLPLNAIFLKHKPQEIGRLPDGDFFVPGPPAALQGMAGEGAFHPSPARKEWRLRELLKTGRFWSLLFFAGCTGCAVYIIMVHSVRYMEDQGVNKMWAASLFAGMSAISAAFRFLWGWFSDRAGREITFTLGGIFFSSGILSLLFLQYLHSPIFLYLFAVLFGIGWGSTSPMFMAVSADLYQGKNFGLIYGFVEGMIGIGGAFGAWVAGFIFDQTQNYLWAFVLAILLNLTSVYLLWVAAPRKVRPIRTKEV